MESGLPSAPRPYSPNAVEEVFSKGWQDESPTASSRRLLLRCSLGRERL